MAITDAQNKEEAAPLKQTGVKQILRIISTQNLSEYNSNVWRVDEVDEYLRTYLDQGFRLLSAHYAGRDEAGIWMFYVLVKE